ncbi:MAG: hypothetical protein A4E65_02849 [Syntrophorhabdus sp. PtaU1.Bin153]|nr:MAG: hypothetical protein A4E65_02849 [Syntrophorhabdus sp. PtaU1.Bin153]
MIYPVKEDKILIRKKVLNLTHSILHMSLGRYRGIPEQTVERRGSSVFCVSKSSEAERERMEPPEWSKRVCKGWSYTCMTLMTNPG